jgi:flagellar hook-basal body complex protein FliE
MIPAVSGAVGPLGTSEWGVGSVGNPSSVGSIDSNGAASGGFGGALSSAINSLEKTQASATSAAQGLATGTLTDPTQAVTAVENASLSMDLAAQVRDKLVSATNTIFQTQV